MFTQLARTMLDACMLQSAGIVDGTSWQGQKTVFSDEEHVPERAPVITPTGTAQQHGVSQNSSMPCCLQKAKWKSIARQLLGKAPDSTMDVDELQRKAIKHALAGQKASKQLRAQAADELMTRLQSSSKFVLCGSRIRLGP